ncbi:MAG: DUF177 domain-containing protein [Deltaproteobacteria bacterium]|nr:DUF177 domain-containing protein [Deltaproteobacteria bacterium]
MQFRLEDIPQEGREATFSQGENWLDERLQGEERTFRFISPITVHLSLSKLGNTILVKSRAEAKVEWSCARCLEIFSLGLTSEYSTILKPKPGFSLQGEVVFTREDVETEFYEGEEIDLTSLVQDQVLLALPQKALCREECRGLCPRCGKNLNREVCECAVGFVDPRLEILRKGKFK